MRVDDSEPPGRSIPHHTATRRSAATETVAHRMLDLVEPLGVIPRSAGDDARVRPVPDHLRQTRTVPLLDEISEGRVVVLDGGMSNLLEDRGHDLSDELWTARLLRDEPAEIVAAHRTYYEAGADVATTASYQASVPSLVRAGLTAEVAAGLIRSSVHRAREAADEVAASTGRELLVAASVGPYGAALADGSEYRGRYGVCAATLRDFHAPRLELLSSAAPDLIAVETIPDLEEAEVLVPLLDELGLPAWFAYSVSGGETRAGQPLAAAYEVLAGSSAIIAAGVNCSAPTDVLHAVQTAVSVTGKPGVAYPNRGETWDAESRSWAGQASFDLDLAASWVEAGARLVGGCCRVGPADIARLATTLDALPNRP